MKKIILLCFFSSSLFANATVQLSDSAYISFLTCEPSDEIYARFWHTAIRVCDPQNNIDYAYNYGIFDFSTKYFVPKFVSGLTDYTLEIFDTEDFLSSYKERKSTIYEQVLNINKAEKQALFDALNENYLPQNRVYRYNFVYDNCATRAYYIIKNVLDNNSNTILVNYTHKTTSFRAIFEEFLGRDNWQRFGIDFLIGREADKPIKTHELVAFPKYTMMFIASIYLWKDNGFVPLVSETNYIVKYPTIMPSEDFIFRPTILCSLLLILVVWISLISWKRQKYFVWLDFTLFFVLGLIGAIIFFLMFFSVHPLVFENYNILWVNPLLLIFSLLILKKSWRHYLAYFTIFNAFTTILAIVVFLTRYQVMNAAFLSLMAMMLIRSVLFFQQNANVKK